MRAETVGRGVILLTEIALGLGLSVAPPAFCQTDVPQPPVPALVGIDNSSTPAPSNNPDINDDRMMTPPPVSGQAYSTTLASEDRSNYLRAGLSFTGVYMDNLEGGVAGYPVSDISYSVTPTVGLDESTSRLHCRLTYAPGFTFYERHSGFNQADQNGAIQFDYRLSPHVTFTASDRFQKSSTVFNQPSDFSSGTVSGGTQGPNFSIIAPTGDQLSNYGNIGISYQFALNDMVAATGTFSNLHYSNPEQVSGLYESSSQSGLFSYSHRNAGKVYLGVTYQYQRLMSYPSLGLTKTQTQAAMLFVTVTPHHNLSFSFFGGPQYSYTILPPTSAQSQPTDLRKWDPSMGASMGWKAHSTSFAVSYARVTASGGGLVGASKQDSATLSIRQQFTGSLNASLIGGYAQNDVLGSAVLGQAGGHTISGTASLQKSLGQRLSMMLGYTRLHQSYANIQAISATPDTNREFVSISYQFSRPLGR